LKRDGLTPTLEVVQDPREVRGALGHFFRLHGARASVTSGTAHRNVFDTDAKRAFLVEVCERLALQGRTRIFLLKIGDRVVATRIGFAMDATLYLYYSGYDPEFGKYSVMTTTVAEAMKHAILAGFSSVNLSSGNDISKTRWAPREDLYCEVEQVSPAPRGKLAVLAYEQSRRLLQSRQVPTAAAQSGISAKVPQVALVQH
jgi:CelD/BcsL family acetyltransferase involved in cellulose biosynthesis